MSSNMHKKPKLNQKYRHTSAEYQLPHAHINIKLSKLDVGIRNIKENKTNFSLQTS